MTAKAKKPRKSGTPPSQKRNGRHRVTPAETEARIDRIVFLMIKGKWTGVELLRLAKAWKLGEREVGKLADRAAVRVETAGGKLGRLVTQAHADLEAIQHEARKKGNLTAAVRAIDVRLKLAGAYAQHRPGRGVTQEREAPRGLPPELAALAPPPTHEEVEHFASVRPEDCAVDACRVHGKVAPSADAVH